MSTAVQTLIVGLAAGTVLGAVAYELLVADPLRRQRNLYRRALTTLHLRNHKHVTPIQPLDRLLADIGDPRFEQRLRSVK